MLVFSKKLILMELQVCLFSVIGGFRWFRVGSLHKNIQLILEFLNAPSNTFPTIINDLPDDVICNIVIYADNTAHYSKCNQASDLWQGVELVSELKSGLRHSRLGQKMTCSFQCWKKKKLFCLTGLITLVLFMWKWMGLLPRKNNLLRCWGWLESMTHCWNIASLSLFYRYYFGRCSLELAQLVHHS